MPSAPNPKKKTSPVVWVGLVALAVAAFMLTSPSETPTSPTAAKKKPKSTSKDSGLYLPEDSVAKFASISTPPVDVFTPLVKKEARLAALPPDPTGGRGIPLGLTGGEANWFYTGLVELDGTRQALLENSASGETVYVSPGEGWKASRVRSVDISSVVLVGPDGTVVDVPLLDYGIAPGSSPSKTSAIGGTQPMSVTGVIGGSAPAGGNTLAVRPVAGTATMTLPDGRTMQVPFDANAATAAATDSNNANGNRRRNRRNRNQGDPNVP